MGTVTRAGRPGHSKDRAQTGIPYMMHSIFVRPGMTWSVV